MLDVIEAYRVNTGKNQEDTARDLGYSLSRYSRIERGDVRIDIDDVMHICDHFGIDNPRSINWHPKKNWKKK